MTSAGPSEELRILDGRGCLTEEALCFTDQIPAEHREVVERHSRSCLACAQRQTSLARAAERFRRARPRPAVASEIKLLARQAALRSLAARRQREAGLRTERTLAAQTEAARRAASVPFYRSRTFWIAMLTGMGTALALASLTGLLLHLLGR